MYRGILFLLVSTYLFHIGGLQDTTLITVPPESRNATVGETVTFSCISPFGNSLTVFALTADPTMGNMTKSNDVFLDNGNRQKTLNITVPPEISEIVVTCTAIRTGKKDSKIAKLMIQGLLSGVGNLTSSEANHCTLHFTWTAPYTLQGVPINYYTINITRHSDGAVLRSDTTNTTEYLYTVSSLGETLEVMVVAVNGAGTGNVSSITTKIPLIKVVKNGAERSSNNWSYIFTIDGVSSCGNAISHATVEACLSSCVNSSGTFKTSDGRRMTNVTFTKLTENKNYSHSTIHLFVNEKMVMSQQVTISTFDIQKTSLNDSIIDGLVCLNVEFVVGSASTSCFSKFKSIDTGEAVLNATINETSRCVPNVPAISVDILSTDPDAVDEIDTNPAYILPGVVVPYYTPSTSYYTPSMLVSSIKSTAVTSTVINNTLSTMSTTTSSSSPTTTTEPPTASHDIIIIVTVIICVFSVVTIIVLVAVLLSLCITFKKKKRAKVHVTTKENTDELALSHMRPDSGRSTASENARTIELSDSNLPGRKRRRFEVYK